MYFVYLIYTDARKEKIQELNQIRDNAVGLRLTFINSLFLILLPLVSHKLVMWS